MKGNSNKVILVNVLFLKHRLIVVLFMKVRVLTHGNSIDSFSSASLVGENSQLTMQSRNGSSGSV